jgi:hypothetical protein
MKQITLVVEDKVGLLADISYLLGKSHINIDALSAAVVGGKGIVNLSLREQARAMAVLKANGYKCLESDTLVVKLPNEPGELSKMSRLLANAGISIKSVVILSQDSRQALYALKVDKMAKAMALLAPYLSIEE